MSYAIFSSNIKEDINLIFRLHSFFKEHFPSQDFVIFTEDTTYAISDYAMLSTFYMVGYVGSIVFLNIEDYFNYKDSVRGDKILYIDNQNSNSFSLDRSMMKNCSMITENNNKLEWIKNYEL